MITIYCKNQTAEINPKFISAVSYYQELDVMYAKVIVNNVVYITSDYYSIKRLEKYQNRNERLIEKLASTLLIAFLIVMALVTGMSIEKEFQVFLKLDTQANVAQQQ